MQHNYSSFHCLEFCQKIFPSTAGGETYIRVKDQWNYTMWGLNLSVDKGGTSQLVNGSFPDGSRFFYTPCTIAPTANIVSFFSCYPPF